MTIYRVKTECVDSYSNDPMWCEAPYLTERQYNDLSSEWGDLSGDVEEITVSRYAYADLRYAADCPDRDVLSAAINMLGEWFTEYNMDEWNGEYFEADGLRIYPVYSGEEIVGYEER